jgi:hypothetical protein
MRKKNATVHVETLDTHLFKKKNRVELWELATFVCLYWLIGCMKYNS